MRPSRPAAASPWNRERPSTLAESVNEAALSSADISVEPAATRGHGAGEPSDREHQPGERARGRSHPPGGAGGQAAPRPGPEAEEPGRFERDGVTESCAPAGAG